MLIGGVVRRYLYNALKQKDATTGTVHARCTFSVANVREGA